MTTPEARARQNIDAQLAACGWIVQDRPKMNLYAWRGVAVREFPLETRYADYRLFVDQRAAGVVEAKAERITTEGVLRRAFEGKLIRTAKHLPIKTQSIKRERQMLRPNMKFNPAIHHRRSIRLKGYDYSQPGAFFVTLVTFQREHRFGEIKAGEMQLSKAGQIATFEWNAIPAHFSTATLGE